jgi:phosphatidylglycerol lysyltransferase
VYHASVIFGFIGIFSVFIVAMPVLLYLSLQNSDIPGATAGFYTILTVLVTAVLFARSVQKKGNFYRWAVKGKPKMDRFLTDILSFKLSMKQFWYATIASVLIEIVGVVHLYISMLGAGVEPSLEASIIGYIIATIFLIISPFLRGMGAIEVSLAFILTKYGIVR